MAIPDLNDDGLLPEGLHECSLDEIIERFGQFQQSDCRRRLGQRLQEFFREVVAAGFAAAILLNDHERHFFNILVGRKALFTFQTLTATADTLTFIRRTRINDFVVLMQTKWAFHLAMALADLVSMRFNSSW